MPAPPAAGLRSRARRRVRRGRINQVTGRERLDAVSLVLPGRTGPRPTHRLGKRYGPDVVAPDAIVLPAPRRTTGGVGVVPNAAHSWRGVSYAIPSTYRRSVGFSDRSTEASVGAPDLTACAGRPF